MRLSTFVTAALTTLGVAAAKDVSCFVNGDAVDTVDLDTGVCEFTIPPRLPTRFRFTSWEDFEAIFYYATVFGRRYYNDIAAAGRTIGIPANLLYEDAPVALFGVAAVRNPPTNSTAFLRKRFHQESENLFKRDDLDDFLAYLMNLTGTEITSSDTNIQLSVGDVVSSSAPATSAPATSAPGTSAPATSAPATSEAAPESTPATSEAAPESTPATSEAAPATSEAPATLTETLSSTTLVTITSCSDNACHVVVVPATTTVCTSSVAATGYEGATAVTTDVETTVYTTVCPVESATAVSTVSTVTTLVVTTCVHYTCTAVVVPATPVAVTTASAGTTVVYTSLTPADTTVLSTVTVTTVTPTPEAVATTPATEAAVTTPAAPAPAPAASSSVPPAAAPSVTATGGAAKVGSVAALALIPLAYLL